MKYSIITPVYNGEEYVRETIESVMSQEGDFEIEYIIIDGNSSDKTIEIIKEYKEKIKNNTFPIKCNNIKLKWISEKDNGMYDAINKGFDMATGEIYAWINSDDKYLPKAFETMKNVFGKYKDISWAKGRTVFIDKDAQKTGTSPCFIFNKEWIKRGIYGRYAYFINQDSVFWRSGLYNKSDKIDTSLRYAGDYDLWCKFAKHASLWSVDTPVSIFRQRDGQLSGDMTNYRREQENIKKTGGFLPRTLMLFFFVKNKLAPNDRSLVLHYIYKILFNKRTRQYIAVEKNRDLNKINARSYVSTCKQNDMKKIIILKSAGNELANQLWNYASIYAYALEHDYKVKNPSFFEYGMYFNISASNIFFKFFFFLPFTNYNGRKTAFRRRFWRKFYKWYTKIMIIFINKKLFSYDDENYTPYYLPPTKELSGRLNKLELNKNNIYLDGWLFRNPVGLEKYRKEIKKYFQPKKHIASLVDLNIKNLREKYKNIVGVHIRQGDYKVWRNGAYYIEQKRIREILDEYLKETNTDKAKTCFAITSDGQIDTSFFEGLNIFLSKENMVHDLFFLSKTDIILGSNSTFNAFAGYYGNIPHIVFQKESMDWEYYKGKKTYFQNKYSTLVHY